MKSPYCFIATPKDGVRYDNMSKYGDGNLIKSTSQEDHLSTNRHAIVKALPINYNGDIKVGDTIIVHHNVFRKYYDMKGKEQSGPCHFKDNIYIIEPDQIYLYGKEGDWKAHQAYCFVKPVQKKQNILLSLKTEEELVGELVYINKYLAALGLKKGDNVLFLPDSEYEFNIDGDKLYRMRNKNITVKLN